MAYTQQKSNSRSSGIWKFEIRVPTWSDEGPLQGCRFLVSSHDGRTRDLSEVPFIKALILFRGLHLPDLSTSKPPPTSTITSSIRILTHVFGDDTNIQTIAESIKDLELDGRGKCLPLSPVYINNHSLLVINYFSPCIKKPVKVNSGTI